MRSIVEVERICNVESIINNTVSDISDLELKNLIELIYFFYTRFDRPISTNLWNSYMKLLPLDLCQKSQKYLRWRDQHAFILGKLLLVQGLAKVGIDKKKIYELQYNQYGRPFIDDNIDFNISHSGEYVICAIGKNLRLGVDIEKVEDIEFDDFANVMSGRQWDLIKSSENPKELFYKFWTIKESIIKAEGGGLSIPLLDIHVNDNIVEYKGKTWYLKELILNKSFCTCLATNISRPNLNFNEIDFYSGINKIDKS